MAERVTAGYKYRPLRGLFATMRNAFAEATANRRGLVFALAVMILNDAVWVAFWVVFFHRVGTVRGWDTDGVMLLLAVLTTSAGFSLGLLANARWIGSIVTGGQLDATLSLPVATLGHVLVRRVEPTNLGDFVFGIGLFAIAGHPTPKRIAVFVFVVLVSAALMTSFLVLTGSLAFFGGRSEGGELGFHALLLFGAYPVDVFAGSAKLLLYTVVPAAFVSSIPARLISSFNGRSAAGLVAAAALFIISAHTIFRLGLRRYASGSVWTRG